MAKTIIFDWKRTLYDPDQKVLLSGSLKLLEFIRSKKINMILIGKGRDDMGQEVARLKVKKYFKEIIFAEGEKDIQVFKNFIGKNPKNTLVIGDRVKSELEIGKKLGALTFWLRQGKFANEEPGYKNQMPDFIATNLKELNLRLRQIFD